MRILGGILVVVVQLTLLGCSAGISRSGYSFSESNCHSYCDVIMKNNAVFKREDIEVLGTIKAYDTGFSVNCDEEEVLSRLIEEACSVGADIVNITEEKHPNWWSSCYRARAELIRLRDREKLSTLKSDSRYAPRNVAERSRESRERIQEAVGAGIMGGILGGLMSSHH